MQRKVAALAFVALAWVGCKGKADEPNSMDKLAHDQAVMKAASGAANAVVRNATDCEAAKPLIPEAYTALDQADKDAQSAASKQILGTLRQQVDRVAQLCP